MACSVSNPNYDEMLSHFEEYNQMVNCLSSMTQHVLDTDNYYFSTDEMNVFSQAQQILGELSMTIKNMCTRIASDKELAGRTQPMTCDIHY